MNASFGTPSERSSRPSFLPLSPLRTHRNASGYFASPPSHGYSPNLGDKLRQCYSGLEGDIACSSSEPSLPLSRQSGQRRLTFQLQTIPMKIWRAPEDSFYSRRPIKYVCPFGKGGNALRAPSALRTPISRMLLSRSRRRPCRRRRET